jgi:hypothetical protein
MEYEIRKVTIEDAIVQDDFNEGADLDYIQIMYLLLKDVETGMIFNAALTEQDVRAIINSKSPLTSKDMIDLSIALRAREEPVMMKVPAGGNEITKDSIIESKTLDPAVKKNRKRRRFRQKNRINN